MIIYKVTNLVNNKIYIGQTSQSLKRRQSRHLSSAFSNDSNYAFHKAIRKYGKENFDWEIIDNSETQEELNEKEIYWIKFYNSFSEHGYNMTLGGNGSSGYKMSEESIQKTLDTKLRNGSTNSGSKHPNSKLTEEDVIEIKNLIKSGFSITDIAKQFNVTKHAISDIKRGKSWSHTGEDISYINYNILNEEIVLEIKRLILEGNMRQDEIAKKLNINPKNVSSIKNGNSWKSVGSDLSNLKTVRPKKLTESMVREIKKLINEGITQQEISEIFSISRGLVGHIKRGVVWGHVEVS